MRSGGQFSMQEDFGFYRGREIAGFRFNVVDGKATAMTYVGQVDDVEVMRLMDQNQGPVHLPAFPKLTKNIVMKYVSRLKIPSNTLSPDEIPNVYRTPEVCIAVIRDGFDKMPINFIPKHLLSHPGIRTELGRAFEQNPGPRCRAIEMLYPKKAEVSEPKFSYLEHAAWVQAVHANPWNLQSVPDRCKTPEICFIAMSNNPEAGKWLPCEAMDPPPRSMPERRVSEEPRPVPEQRTLPVLQPKPVPGAFPAECIERKERQDAHSFDFRYIIFIAIAYVLGWISHLSHNNTDIVRR